MTLATLFKAGMLPICAIIISLAPFTTFSQPQTSLLAQTHNNTLSSIISHRPSVDETMMEVNATSTNFYMWSEHGKSIFSYYHEGADQAISSLGIQAKLKSWMLPKTAWVETKEGVEEEEQDAMWDIVTRKENEGTATYSLDKFALEPTNVTASFGFADMELIDVLAIVLLVDVFSLSWYLNRNRTVKLAHIITTYIMAYCLLLK